MGSSFYFLFLCSFIFITMSSSIAQSSFRPKALVFPITKDSSALVPQYVTEIKQKTPLTPVKLTVDLGERWSWVDCENNYVSSTYKKAKCGSAQCSLFWQPSCDARNICSETAINTITGIYVYGDLGQDVVSLQSTNGFNPGRMVTTPNFLFLCGHEFVVEGLANGGTGMLGLGRSKLSLPAQFSSLFGLPRKFAICLSSGRGAMFFGDSPYGFLPNHDLSKSLTYTPLLRNPSSTALVPFEGEPSFEYFIGVKSVRVAGKRVHLNTTLLSINNNGRGGTKISTVNPYTIMETTIYKAVSEAFTQALGVPKVAPIVPFGTCFASKDIGSSRTGPRVPTIDLVMQNDNVVWSMLGANLMVQASKNVSCLGFVDAAGYVPRYKRWSLVGYVVGGEVPITSITIGALQLEDNLLQFDLATSRLGFSNSLLWKQTTCGNFNFSSTV